MSLFSSDTKKTTNTTTNYYTDETNTALAGGDSDVGDSSTVAVNSSLTDNSLAVSMADYSARDYSVRTANSGNTDSSDNSFKNTQMDYSNRTYKDSGNTDSSIKNTQSDYSNRSINDSGNTNITDGGAFKMVGSIFSKFADSMSSQSQEIIKLAGLNQKETLGTINNVTQRSMDTAFAAKSGGTISESADNTTKGFLALAVFSAVATGVILMVRRR